MLMSNRKSKMISIRLSAEEYQRFRELCALYGSRNLSELARDAMNHLLQTHNGQQDGKPDPHELDSQLKMLQDRLETLNADIELFARILQVRRAAGV